MLVDYNPFIDRMIHKYEGGYGWNPKDPGGPTNFGITCYDLAEYRGQKMTSMTTWAPLVRAMPLSEAEAIYKKKYATGLRFDDLPPGIDCAILDYGVNSGVARPVRVARTLLGLPAGGMDIVLIDALKKCEPNDFISKINGERLRFMHAIRGGTAWAEFGHGWGSRVSDLDAYCHHLAAGTIAQAAPPPDLSKVVQPKATNVPKTATKTTTGGAVATGTATIAAGYHWLFTAAAVGVVMAAGIAYEVWQEHKAEAANNLVHV